MKEKQSGAEAACFVLTATGIMKCGLPLGLFRQKGLQRKDEIFLMCLILFFEIGSTHTVTEKVTAAARPSAAQICPLLCCQCGVGRTKI